VPAARRESLLGRNGWLLLVLGVLQLAWLAWFLAEPLPNATTPAGPIRRGLLLLKAFPQVVPGTTFRQSLIGQALDELSHLENLPERIPILGAAGLVLAAALGLGEMVLAALGLRERLAPAERIAIDYGIGTSGLGVLTLAAGRAGFLSPWPFRIALALIGLCGLGVSRFWRVRLTRPSVDVCLLTLLVIGPFLAIMLLGSMLPAIDFDVLEYHLQGPKEYYQAGRIAFLPHNVYTNMPFGVEMLHLAGMEVMGDWWWGGLAGQFLVALYAPAAAVLIAAAARRSGSGTAAWFAAVIYLSTPWVYRLAVIAYVEGPLCFYHAALIWGAVRAWTERDLPRRSMWGLMGLLSGGAMACKYPALISAVIPFGCLAAADAWRHRASGPVLAYLAGWALLMTPWLARNAADTGDPVYPLGTRVFQTRHWDEARERQWQHAHGPRSATAAALWSSMVDVAGRSDWQSPLYLALAPLALLRRESRRFAATLGVYAAYLFLTWWLLTHRLDRFWLPLLPCLAILAGLGADWSRGRAWGILRGAVVAIALGCNFIDCSTALTGLNEWTGSLRFLRRDLPRRLNPPLAAIDRELPPGARILLVGQAAVFHVEHPVLYNTVFNPETIELLAAGRTPEEFRDELRRRGITHIYVDWKEIQRHRDPAGYGFTGFVTRGRFDEWIRSGVLDRPLAAGLEQQLYTVR
jgi:hypothetical protein